MSRFIYRAELDEYGNVLGTTLTDTSGYFAGLTPEQVSRVAEDFYVNYTSGNLSSTFHDVYFNYMLRRKLHEIYLGTDSTDNPQSDVGLRSSTAGQSDSHPGGQSEDTDNL